MSGPNHPRGTTNQDQRGSSYERRVRRQWLLDTYGDGETAPCMIEFDERCLGEVDMVTMTVDRHPIPGIDGGTYVRDNIRPACGSCNSRSGIALREQRRAAQLPGGGR